jgi:hypothetical protein
MVMKALLLFRLPEYEKRAAEREGSVFSRHTGGRNFRAVNAPAAATQRSLLAAMR